MKTKIAKKPKYPKEISVARHRRRRKDAASAAAVHVYCVVCENLKTVPRRRSCVAGVGKGTARSIASRMPLLTIRPMHAYEYDVAGGAFVTYGDRCRFNRATIDSQIRRRLSAAEQSSRRTLIDVVDRDSSDAFGEHPSDDARSRGHGSPARPSSGLARRHPHSGRHKIGASAYRRGRVSSIGAAK